MELLVSSKRIAIVFGLCIAFWSSQAHALPDAHSRAPTYGLGIILGDPTGFTFKARFTREHAIQLHVGFGIGGRYDRSTASFVFDYAYHFADAIPPIERAGWLVPYLGVGAKLGVRESSSDSVRVGIRVPGGLSFFTRGAPVEIFAEIAIGMHVVPGTSALIDGGLGARWHF